ncbi:hypothetical protein D5S18_03065 [Nocardia panacis]|uniref:DUF998 domain-containing protein n=2 Tax=Nocardia panacis TaxID=2340916 RepID=A0A3A4KSP5_9NOCA|nr:hypothetical protein D5S18_03065 [Nocardia panacis]
MTITFGSLATYAVLRHPSIGNVWINDGIRALTGLDNLADLLGDLSGCVAAWGLCTHAAQAWGARWLTPIVTRATLALGATLATLYAISEAPYTDTTYIGHLGGWAELYSYIAALAVIVANVAVLVSTAFARKEIDMSLLMAGALVGLVVGAHRASDHFAPELLADTHDAISWPLTAIAIILYACAGLASHNAKAHEPMPDRERV